MDDGSSGRAAAEERHAAASAAASGECMNLDQTIKECEAQVEFLESTYEQRNAYLSLVLLPRAPKKEEPPRVRLLYFALFLAHLLCVVASLFTQLVVPFVMLIADETELSCPREANGKIKVVATAMMFACCAQVLKSVLVELPSMARYQLILSQYLRDKTHREELESHISGWRVKEGKEVQKNEASVDIEMEGVHESEKMERPELKRRATEDVWRGVELDQADEYPRWCTAVMLLGISVNYTCGMLIPLLLYQLMTSSKEPSMADTLLNGLALNFLVEVDNILVVPTSPNKSHLDFEGALKNHAKHKLNARIERLKNGDEEIGQCDSDPVRSVFALVSYKFGIPLLVLTVLYLLVMVVAIPACL